jgi:threonine/homoserine/homoserine lactone efflux protein
MWPVVGAVLPQAAAIALSPVPMACIVLVLMSARPVRAGLVFAAGWVAALVIVTGLVAGLAHEVAAADEESARDGNDVLQLAAGVLFALLAVRYWRRRPGPDEEPERPRIFDRIATLSGPGLALAGAGAALANVKNLPLVLSAGSSIGAAGLSAGATAGAVLVFVGVASATVVLPVVAVAGAGAERSAPVLKSFEEWLVRNLTTITVVVLVVLAAALIGNGLDLFR